MMDLGLCIRAKGSNAIDIFKDAVQCLEYGNYEKAYQLFNEMSKSGDQTISLEFIYFNKGLCLKMLEKYAEAAQNFIAALQFNPKNSITYFHIVDCYTACEIWDKALLYSNMLHSSQTGLIATLPENILALATALHEKLMGHRKEIKAQELLQSKQEIWDLVEQILNKKNSIENFLEDLGERNSDVAKKIAANSSAFMEKLQHLQQKYGALSKVNSSTCRDNTCALSYYEQEFEEIISILDK